MSPPDGFEPDICFVRLCWFLSIDNSPSCSHSCLSSWLLAFGPFQNVREKKETWSRHSVNRTQTERSGRRRRRLCGLNWSQLMTRGQQ